MKKITVIAMSILAAFSLVACAAPAVAPEKTAEPAATKAAEAPEAPEAEAPKAEEVAANPEIDAIEAKFNYKIVPNTSGKEVRIAVICVNNNPFWVDVVSGVEDIKKVMAAKYNCTVDLITVDDFDGQVFSDTIEACIVKGYDAITTVGVSDAIVPSINRAVDAGIPVYTFNSDTAKESKRTAFHGQDLHSAGGVAGEALAKAIGGEGKVAVITGFFSVNAHELRRNGGLEAFAKYPNIEVVGGVECLDSNDAAYSQTKDFLTANPDLKGIYCTAAGQIGAAKAVKELNLTEQVKIVCFDYMQEVIDGLYDKSIAATIGQDPYGQGADPVIFAYNEKITGKAEYTGMVYTKMDVVTSENVAEFFPR